MPNDAQTTLPRKRSYLALGARFLLGGVFFAFGLNGFLRFIPLPPPSGEMGAFLGALIATGYMLPWIKVVEVLVGVLLLWGRYVPLALLLLAPILLNIVAVHLFLDGPSTWPMPLALLGLTLFLAWHHRDRFRPVLRP